ncbi:DUF4407 domain-containing protein [Lentzea jiangxiensis]|uniref:DUF4407 domain-containing protein n=1 Tax=Lentzea jiangxiensis TaxID=641025 RepID=A0A1H0EH33_9PSEU|nr:DUF4407 domain-containing protein [Lentzea jiangxiensis]SDN81715.1 protein of unknown function [Lentzea jiangxiensis]
MPTETLPADLTEIPVSPYRPAFPDLGFGRRLRAVIGIKEDVLDWAPEERPRYTKMGVIVLTTGALSGLSILVVLMQLLDGDAWWRVLAVAPVAAFWAIMIINLDSWLIASMHGASGARFVVFIPRLVISVLLGLTIAEPLVVWVFSPAIEKQVEDSRADEIARYASTWKACNPSDGAAVETAECADYRLNLSSSLAALRGEHDTLVAKRDDLKKEVDEYLKRWNELETIAQAECKGLPGPLTTGDVGEGPECTRNRNSADQYRRDTRLDERQADLGALDTQIVGLKTKLQTAETSYGSEVKDAIDKKVEERKANRTKTGILEEFEALGELSKDSVPVNLGHWALRLLLVLFDCLPVLAKWMNGSTTYDRLIARQIEADKRLHSSHVNLFERRDSAIMDVKLERIQRERHERLERLDVADRQAKAQRESELDAEIERLAARLRGEPI